MLQACSQGVDLKVDRHFGEGQDQLATINDVADGSSGKCENEERQSRGGLRQRHIHRPGVEGNHEPGGTHTLHECADIGNNARAE